MARPTNDDANIRAAKSLTERVRADQLKELASISAEDSIARDAALEEAAQIADAEARVFEGDDGEVYIARTIANKIRALKAQVSASE